MIEGQKIWRMRLVGVITMVIATGAQIQAKTIDYTPDITSDSYWDTHHIGAVRVTATGKDAQGSDYVIYQLETQISDEPIEQARTILVSHLWLGSGREEPQISVNDRFILYDAKEGPAPIVAVKLDGPEGSRLLDGLLQIARLRANRGDLQTYLESIFADDPVVARYSIRHLLAQSPPRPPSGYVARLLRLRDEEFREATIRVLASRLANRLERQLEESDSEYSWLQASFARSKNVRWTELTPFVDRLLEFKAKRPETIAFFARLVTDSSSAKSVRIAVYGTFENPRMFHFEAPDKESEQIFETCIQMLHDREPEIRGAGAALLHNISVRVHLPARPDYIERSGAAIGEVLAAEEDPIARHYLNHYRQLILESVPRSIEIQKH